MTTKSCKYGDLCANRESLINSIIRINVLLESKGKTFTIIELETRVGMLESLFDQLNILQSKIEQSGIEEDSDKRQEYEELYIEVKSKILSTIAERTKKLNDESNPAHKSSAAVSLTPVISTRLANLPKLKIPSFSGKYTDWTNWFNTFKSLIHDDETLDSLSKFVHLRSSLESMPLRTIESIELTAENYAHALNILCDRFDNKAIIFQAHIKELFELPKVSQRNVASLRELIDKVNAHLRALKSLGSTEDLANVILYCLICSKIDAETMRKWEDQLECSELPSWQGLSRFLTNRCTTLENRDVNGSTNCADKGKKPCSLAATGTADKRNCWMCGSQHSIMNCPVFLKLSPMQRFSEIKKGSRCIICFLKSHSAKKCTAERCKICSGGHHSLLHRYDKRSEHKEEQTSKNKLEESAQPNGGHFASRNTAVPTSSYSSLIISSSINFLATALVLVRKSNGSFIECRAILDAGSQVNFITEALAKRLRLDIEADKATISGIGNAKTEAKGKVKAYIQSRITNYSERLSFNIMPAITQYASSLHVEFPKWKLPKNIELADPQFNEARGIDILIGVSAFFKLLSVGQIQLGENMPILQKSVLGWLIAGEYNPSELAKASNYSHSAVEDKGQLTELVERFWKCEEVDATSPSLSADDQLCEDHFINTVKRTLAGRFMVRLPFKSQVGVGESYTIAMRRLLNLERKLEQDMNLKEEYTKFIQEYQDLGHLENVTHLTVDQCNYFMPHHAVVRPESLSTKLRVVFDASCRTNNGNSLNDVLFTGPKIQPDLFEILIRFRCYRFVVTADISKMYRQVLVDEEDSKWQCILWRENKSKTIELLRLKTVTYGTRPAPFLAVRCLKYLAEKYEEEFPIASRVLRENFYMDDMLAGANSLSELARLRTQVTELLNLGKFELHKWRCNIMSPEGNSVSSNASSVFQKLPLHIDAHEGSKTLGVLWNAALDSFSFSYNNVAPLRISKRTVLSELSQLFDPLGLLNPVIVIGKLLVQELWLLRLNWDESIPQELNERWKKFREEINMLSEFVFPRYVADIWSAESIEVHGFSDASIRAIGCTIYIRTIDKQGKVDVNLLTSKSRIAPLKSLTLPRLELQGAVMLTRLVERIKGALPMKVTSYFYWTDSNVVLNWLSSHPSRWLTFVANRVAYVQEHSVRSNWFKIDSKSNPADIVSRGCWPRQLINNQLWFKGPTFLQSKIAEWPDQIHKQLSATDENLEERRTKFSFLSQVPLSVDLISTSKFGNDYSKLVRTFSFIYRWRNNIRLKRSQERTLPYQSSLQVKELRMGLNYIIYNIQQTNFSTEIQSLSNESLIKASKIQKLSPFIDSSEGISILRVGGRLSKSDLNFKTKYPAILPAKNTFTRAMANYLHKLNLHVGPQTLLSLMRQRFWVLNGRSLAQQTTRNCLTCFRHRPKAAEQLMGDLPSSRIVGNVFPFQKTGVDFAGPLAIHYKIRGKRPDKAYLALFICFVTKACHLEIVSDLSTAAFICTLKRFFARRGLCTDIYCDNGTNFQGAARELQQLMSQVYAQTAKNSIQDDCASRGVNFHFIPPSSPHIGGLWESSIKVAKTMLVRHIKGASLTFEELTTIVAEIEAIMNSRPLYAMSSDPNDLEALTPGHFLIGRPLKDIPEPFNEDELKVPPINRWKRVHHIKCLFWHRWSKEYLLNLQQRNKWQSSQENLQPGRLVLIIEENQPPLKWTLGRIESTCPGKDGLVRVVQVKTKSGILKRNVHKLCPLPQSSQE